MLKFKLKMNRESSTVQVQYFNVLYYTRNILYTTVKGIPCFGHGVHVPPKPQMEGGHGGEARGSTASREPADAFTIYIITLMEIGESKQIFLKTSITIKRIH